MFRLFIFFTLTAFASTSLAAPSCGAFLDSKQAELSGLQPHSLRRTDPQSWDVLVHGNIIKSDNLDGLDSVQNMLSSRDGTYPLIIDDQNNLVIDHRLPEASFLNVEADAFVGNHLGLFNKLKETTGVVPSVVFAGQVRVVGGKVLNLIDQSGSFYFSPDDFGLTGDDKINQLAELNQIRLDLAAQLLRDLNLIDENTTTINFVHRFGNSTDSNSQNEGHVLAKDAAKFERFCRNTSSCWEAHQKIETALRQLSAKYGQKRDVMKFIKDQMREKTGSLDFEVVQIWTMVLSEGATELLSKPDAFDQNTIVGALINDFINSLDDLEI